MDTYDEWNDGRKLLRIGATRFLSEFYEISSDVSLKIKACMDATHYLFCQLLRDFSY